MKNKQKHFTRGSFALLFFVILGYTIKFYPSNLSDLDLGFQTWLRGETPDHFTQFFQAVTVLGNTPIIFTYILLLAAFFYFVKNWRMEGIFLLGGLSILGIFSSLFKLVYSRPRPDVVYLIQKPIGASFPSWHTAASMLVALMLVIIVQQRVKNKICCYGLQVLLVTLAVLVALSRVYLGVHYPTDILGGWLLAFAVVVISYPFYDQKRFEWRFTSRQK